MIKFMPANVIILLSPNLKLKQTIFRKFTKRAHFPHISRTTCLPNQCIKQTERPHLHCMAQTAIGQAI